MRNLTTLSFFGLILAAASLSHAGERAPVLVGMARPTWRNLPGTDGKKYSLADLSSCEVVVVAVTCNHCPIAIEYYDRMKEFAKQHCGPDGKVALLAVSVSDLETDKLPRMKEMSERRNFNFPYLYDESQQIARSLGATVTPQFFVLNKQRVLIYRGAWDDSVNESKVATKYVEAAVEAILSGKSPAVGETKARGCLIDYLDSP